jgi:hypothetical protein
VRDLRGAACGQLLLCRLAGVDACHAGVFCPGYIGKSGRRVVSTFIATAFAQDSAKAANRQWRKVADQLRPNLQSLLP